MLNRDVLREMKKFAAGQPTQFDIDRHRQFPVRLAGVGDVSTDPAVARDQFARFATKNPAATYASLDPRMRAKAHFAMAFASQGTHNAVAFGFGLLLDPAGNRNSAMFNSRGGMERSFEMEIDGQGGFAVRFRSQQRPTTLALGDEVVPCGPGS